MSSFYPNPEKVFAALWTLVADTPGFVTASRRWQHWGSMPPEQQPALFQVQVPDGTMAFAWSVALIPTISFKGEFVIYCRVEETLEGIAATKINGLVAKILARLEPQFKESVPRKPLLDADGNSIGFNVRVAGALNIVEGVGTDNAQAVAFIPVEIIQGI